MVITHDEKVKSRIQTYDWISNLNSNWVMGILYDFYQFIKFFSNVFQENSNLEHINTLNSMKKNLIASNFAHLHGLIRFSIKNAYASRQRTQIRPLRSIFDVLQVRLKKFRKFENFTNSRTTLSLAFPLSMTHPSVSFRWYT